MLQFVDVKTKTMSWKQLKELKGTAALVIILYGFVTDPFHITHSVVFSIPCEHEHLVKVALNVDITHGNQSMPETVDKIHTFSNTLHLGLKFCETTWQQLDGKAAVNKTLLTRHWHFSRAEHVILLDPTCAIWRTDYSKAPYSTTSADILTWGGPGES